MPLTKKGVNTAKRVADNFTQAFIYGGTSAAVGGSAAKLSFETESCNDGELCTLVNIGMALVGSGILLDWLAQIIFLHVQQYIPRGENEDNDSQANSPSGLTQRIMVLLERLAQLCFFAAAYMTVTVLFSVSNGFSPQEGMVYGVAVTAGFGLSTPPTLFRLSRKGCTMTQEDQDQLKAVDYFLGVGIVAGFLFALAALGMQIIGGQQPNSMVNGSSTQSPSTSAGPNQDSPDALQFFILGTGGVSSMCFLIAAIRAVVMLLRSCEVQTEVKVPDNKRHLIQAGTS